LKILIAEDDRIFRTILERMLPKWGHEVLLTEDGEAALAALQAEGGPKLAILDWMMPILDGPEVCRRVRAKQSEEPPYILLLTAKAGKENIVAGLEAGADDYLSKPFDHDELRVRIQVGCRIVELQTKMRRQLQDLQDAIGRVKQLQGLLPICAWCRKVRDDQNYWRKIEDYVSAHSGIHWTHGMCPSCLENALATELGQMSVPVS
jgi:phosphoserine phosphatase RsbU/P